MPLRRRSAGVSVGPGAHEHVLGVDAHELARPVFLGRASASTPVTRSRCATSSWTPQSARTRAPASSASRDDARGSSPAWRPSGTRPRTRWCSGNPAPREGPPAPPSPSRRCRARRPRCSSEPAPRRGRRRAAARRHSKCGARSSDDACCEIELGFPAQEDLARRPVPEAAVDLGAPADARALDVPDGDAPEDRRHAPAAVEAPHRLGRARAVPGQVPARSLLEDAHVQAALRELERGRRTACARADDQDLHLLLLRLSHAPPAPARRRASRRRARGRAPRPRARSRRASAVDRTGRNSCRSRPMRP